MRRSPVLAGLVAVALAGCGGPSPRPAPTASTPAPPAPTAPSDGGLTMAVPRATHTATPLPDGRVLVIGGCPRQGCDGPAADSSELFDPRTATFGPGPRLQAGRFGHTATPLTDGRVLVTGGFPADGSAPLDSAEVYHPATGRFEPTGAMAVRRGEHTATRLPDGRVLVTGGAGNTGVLTGAELYDPGSGQFSAVAPLPQPRALHAAVLLGDGRVLLAGGRSGRDALLDTAVIFDPGTGAWQPAGLLDAAKYKLALAPLPDGGALLVGGQTSDDRAARLPRTERFDPAAGRFVPGPVMVEPRYKISDAVVVLPDGRVIITGGLSVEAYAAGALRTISAAPGAERQFPASAVLPDGRVLVTGGYDDRTRITASAFVVRP